ARFGAQHQVRMLVSPMTFHFGERLVRRETTADLAYGDRMRAEFRIRYRYAHAVDSGDLRADGARTGLHRGKLQRSQHPDRPRRGSAPDTRVRRLHRTIRSAGTRSTSLSCHRKEEAAG